MNVPCGVRTKGKPTQRVIYIITRLNNEQRSVRASRNMSTVPEYVNARARVVHMRVNYHILYNLFIISSYCIIIFECRCALLLTVIDDWKPIIETRRRTTTSG